MRQVSTRLRFAAYRGACLRSGGDVISSARISEMTGVNAAQVRRDLSEIGKYGRRGVGYRAVVLVELLGREMNGAIKEVERHERLVGLARSGASGDRRPWS